MCDTAPLFASFFEFLFVTLVMMNGTSCPECPIVVPGRLVHH